MKKYLLAALALLLAGCSGLTMTESIPPKAMQKMKMGATTAPAAPQVFNVVTLGADPTGQTDSTAVLQAIADAAAAQRVANSPGATIYFPGVGGYLTTRPILIHGNNIQIVGDGDSSTITGYGQFPIFYVAPSGNNAPIAPSPLGSGNAIQLNPSQWSFMDVREVQGVNLDGLGGLTAECFFQPSALSTDGHNIMASCGRVTSNSPINQAFYIGTNAGSQFRALLTVRTASGPVIVSLSNPATFTPGTLYNLALTYDGTTARFFVNGQPVASQAVSGVIQQQIWENMPIGSMMVDFPAQGYWTAAMPGLIDGVRISKVCRYTAAYAMPTTRPTFDANTLYVSDFNSVNGELLHGQSAWGNVWQPWRQEAINNISDVTIRNLRILNGSHGVLAERCVRTKVRDLTCNSYTAVELVDNCYGSLIYTVHAQGQRSAVLINGASGDSIVRNIYGETSAVCIAIMGSQDNCVVENVLSENAAIGGIFTDASGGVCRMSLRDFVVSTESCPTFTGGLFFSGFSTIEATGAVVEVRSDLSGPAITFDAVKTGIVLTPTVMVSNANSIPVNFVRPPLSPIKIIAPLPLAAGLNWTTPANAGNVQVTP